MRIVFVLESEYLPKVIGGMERSIEALCVRLKERRHEPCIVRVFDYRETVTQKLIGAVRIRPESPEVRRGYRVYRARRRRGIAPVRKAIQYLKPDIVVLVLSAGDISALAQPLALCGAPLMVYLQSYPLPDRADLEGLFCLTPSRWLLTRCHDAGLSEAEVLHPIIEPDCYDTAGSRDRVTVVGASADKGLALAIEIARLCPDIPFDVYQTWQQPDQTHSKQIEGLENIRITGAVPEFGDVLARTRILLVPSRMETWCRAVTEAQVNGIPAVASDVGALPESVGTGGVLLPFDSGAMRWADAIRELWNHPDAYAALSSNARAMAARPQLEVDRIVDQFLNRVRAVCRRGNAMQTHAEGVR